MMNNKKIIVVLPAYNAAGTLQKTVSEIPREIVDEIILVDDASSDETVSIARKLGLKHVVVHERNRGYGANQKTCYKAAMDLKADIVIMLHPDYQYTPKLIPSMAALISSGVFPVVMASRILGNGAIKGGMPVYKYISNRVLTFIQNLCTGAKLSEYHSGYRAFAHSVLQDIDFQKFSDNHIFDNEMLSEIILRGYKIGEITCPTNYFEEASSLNFKNSLVYGAGVLRVSLIHLVKRFLTRSS
jgi:glycosyltransferase involved in cell wall biosynthesis